MEITSTILSRSSRAVGVEGAADSGGVGDPHWGLGGGAEEEEGRADHHALSVTFMYSRLLRGSMVPFSNDSSALIGLRLLVFQIMSQ